MADLLAELPPGSRVLAGDIGGTKSHLALFEVGPLGLTELRSERFPSADFPDQEAVVEAFFGEHPEARAGIRAACFGIPGPVIDNTARTSNLAWEIDGAHLAAETGLPSVLLINDLVATAEGIPLLQEDEIVTVHPGDPEPDGNRALIAAGTGLGMGLLPWRDGAWWPVASEGGHMDFAPRDEEEIGLLLYLRERLQGRVSVERVVSGPGLFAIYEYLRESLRDRENRAENSRVREALAAGEDPSKVISEAGLADTCGLCARTLELFASAYGAAAGNLALLGTATGGVYVGGGVAPKILPRLTDGTFLRAFLDKGRFTGYLEKVPVRIILNQATAVLGAARQAVAVATAHGKLPFKI
jgi:glucokinase